MMTINGRRRQKQTQTMAKCRLGHKCVLFFSLIHLFWLLTSVLLLFQPLHIDNDVRMGGTGSDDENGPKRRPSRYVFLKEKKLVFIFY
jgi:hypothetical protein